jgi:hypothetical protein
LLCFFLPQEFGICFSSELNISYTQPKPLFIQLEDLKFFLGCFLWPPFPRCLFYQSALGLFTGKIPLLDCKHHEGRSLIREYTLSIF